MAFLFKSKKSQDRALSSRDGNSGSQGSIQSTSSRLARDEKNAAAQRATPTGSLNSVDENGTSSPEQLRRGGSLEQTQPSSDLPVSPCHISMHLLQAGIALIMFSHDCLDSFETHHQPLIPMPLFTHGRKGG